METTEKTIVTIESTIKAPVEKVWEYWNTPRHIIQWNQASPDWHSPKSEVDLRAGGKFSTRMEAKDGSMGFDFGGVYDVVDRNKYIEYTLGDGRKVKNNFNAKGEQTRVVVEFEAEGSNPVEMQRGGWQAILDSFKKYTEEN